MRFELQVRVPVSIAEVENAHDAAAIDVPSSTIGMDLLALLESGRSSDVSILVDGERFQETEKHNNPKESRGF